MDVILDTLYASLAVKANVGLKGENQCSDCSHNDVSLAFVHEKSTINLCNTNDRFLLKIVLLYKCNSRIPQGNTAQSSGSFQALDLRIIHRFSFSTNFIEKQSSFCPFQTKIRIRK